MKQPVTDLPKPAFTPYVLCGCGCGRSIAPYNALWFAGEAFLSKAHVLNLYEEAEVHGN